MSTLARETTRQRAARDIVMQVVVRIANLAVGAVVTALVVRTLGQTGYGEWSTIFVALALIGYFANFGMEGVALREAARDPEHEHEWIGAVMMLRLIVRGPGDRSSRSAPSCCCTAAKQMLIAGVILIVTMPFDGVGALALLFQLRVDNRVPMLVLTLRSVLWGVAVLDHLPRPRRHDRAGDRDGGHERDRLDRPGGGGAETGRARCRGPRASSLRQLLRVGPADRHLRRAHHLPTRASIR